jgi:hypothetical protein
MKTTATDINMRRNRYSVYVLTIVVKHNDSTTYQGVQV